MTEQPTKEARDVKESPTLPEQPKEAQAEVSQEDSTKALLAELSRLKIQKPEELLNMAKASSQSGRTANLYGEATRKIAELEGQIKMLTAMSQQKKQSTPEDPDGHSIDLAALIEQKSYAASKKAVQEVVDQMSAQQRRQYEEVAAIRSDRVFPQLEETWNKYIANPEAQAILMSGQATMKDLYNDLKTRYMERLLDQSREVIENLSGKSPEKAKPLHVESSQTRVPSMPQEEDDKKADLRKIDEARASGRMSSDQALRALFDRISPPTDPIWNVETAPGSRRKGT